MKPGSMLLASAVTIAALALAGCGSTSGSLASGTPSSSTDPSAAACASAGGTWDGGECMSSDGSGPLSSPPSSPAEAPSSDLGDSSGSSMCTTNACIADDAKRSLVGQVAKDNAVVTKATCKKSTVKRTPGPVYSVTCTAHYSDGMVARGIASLVISQDKIAWEPTDIISYGSGG